MKVKIINTEICSLKVEQVIDCPDGKELDTEITFDGSVTVSGKEREDFMIMLQELIEAYQI